MSTRWTIGKARQRFSELIRAVEEGPQPIYHRDRPVAVVIDLGTYRRFQAWQREQETITLGQAFRELREICREEGYELELPKRSAGARPNPFVEVLDELAR